MKTEKLYSKDFLGNDVSEGDAVVFVEPNYRSLMKGSVLKITSQKFLIEFEYPDKSVSKVYRDKNYVIKTERN